MSKHSPVHAVTARRVTNGSVSLAVFEQGKADGETIVLVHGWPDTHELWNRIVPLLADDFRVVSYDSRGAGESTIPSRVQDYQAERTGRRSFCPSSTRSARASRCTSWHMTGDLWKRGKRSASRVPRRRSRRSRPSRAPISIISASGSGRACPSVVSSAPAGAGNCVGLHRSVPDSRAVHPPVASVVLQALAGISGLLRRSGPPVWSTTAPTIADDMVNGLKLYRANIRPSLGKPRESVHGRACSAHSEQVRQSRSSGGIRRHRKMGLRPAAT